MKILKYAAIFTLCISGIVYGGYYSPQTIMVDTTNEFGVCVLQVVASRDENIAFSPYGLVSVALVLYEGSRGPTAAEIHNTLRLPWDREVTRLGFRDMHRYLKSYFSNDGFLRGLVLSKPNVVIHKNYSDLLEFYGFDVNTGMTTVKPETTENPNMTTVITTTVSTTKETTTVKTTVETTPETTVSPDSEVENITIPTTKLEPTQPTESTSMVMLTDKKPDMPEIMSQVNLTYLTTTPEQPESKEMEMDMGKPQSTTEVVLTSKKEMTEAETVEVTVVKTTMSKTVTSSVPNTTPMIETTKDETDMKTAETNMMQVPLVTPPTVTEAPVPPTEGPVPSTEAPIPSTEAPIPSTEAPIPSTEAPIPSTEAPIPSTAAPVPPTDIPVPSTVAPVPSTDDPAPSTEAPVKPTEVSMQSTQALVQTTEAPVPPTEAVQTTEAPVPPTEAVQTTEGAKMIEEESTEAPAQMKEQPEVTTVSSTLATEVPVTPAPKEDESMSTLATTAQDKSEATIMTMNPLPSTNPESTVLTEVTMTDVETTLKTTEPTPQPEEAPNRKKRSSRSLDSSHLAAEHRDGVSNWVPHYQDPRWNYHAQNELWFFTYNGGENVPVLTYTAYLPFAYVSQLNALALQLPLDDPRYSIVIILPEERLGLSQVLYELQWCSIRAIMSQMKTTAVYAVVPTFTIVKHVNLGPALSQLGIRSLFDPFKSDLSTMSPESHVFVRTIEQVVTVSLRKYYANHRWFDATPSDVQQHFIVNHPFAYFVLDKETEVALMIGTIVNPIAHNQAS